MGLFLFLLGVALAAAGLATGLPLWYREAVGTGGAMGIMIGIGLVGAGLATWGLIMGKSKPAPAPAPAPPPPPPPAAEPPPPMCPTCGRRLMAAGANCPFCNPAVQSAPPPPMMAPVPSAVAPDVAARGRGAVEGPNGYMQVIEGPSAGQQVMIKPKVQVTIGRGDGNSLVLADPDVSGNHCTLTFGNDRVMFQDNGSTNGSFLNEQPFRQGRINSGDTLRLGPRTKIFFSFK